MAKKGKIKPLGDHILIRRVEAQNVTKGGIVLPESAKEKPKEGIVLALGDGKLLETGERSTFQVKTRCSFPPMPGPRSRWTARNSCWFARTRFLRSSTDPELRSAAPAMGR